MGRYFFVVFGALLASSLPAVEATNQWYLRGPDGGFGFQVAIDPISHRPIAGGNAGLFTYDAGTNTWSYANSGAPTPYVAGIATTSTATYINSGGYVTRSTDGGNTWTNVSSIAMAGNVASIAASPNAPSRVHAALNPGGLYRSDDKGATWQLNPLTPPNATLELVRVSPTNGNLMFVSGEHDQNGVSYLYRSSDGGVTFAEVCHTGGTPTVPLHFVDVVQSVSSPSSLIALVAPAQDAFTFKDQGGEIWTSNDAGLTWSFNVPNFYIAPESNGGGEPRTALIDRFAANTVYIASTFGVFKSVNGNAAVLSSTGMLQMGQRSSGAQPYDEVDGLAQGDDGTLYAATNSGGIYKSTNGAASWTAINAGYTGLNVRMFAFQPGNTGVVLAGSADPSDIGAVYRSTDFGASWIRSSVGMDVAAIRGLAFSPTNPNLVIAGGLKQSDVGGAPSQGLWRSTDAGVSWSKISGLITELRFVAKRIVLFDPNNSSKVLAASPSMINISSDAGLTWINSKDNPVDAVHPSGYFGGLPTQVVGNTVTTLGLAAGPGPVSGTRFYASFDGGAFPSNPPPGGAGGIYYSDDGGFHWTVASGLPDDSASYFAVSPTSGTVYVSKVINGSTRQGGVYKSTNYGQTWADSSAGLPCRDIFTVAADPVDPQVVWTACRYSDITQPGGIFRSNDAGASWVPYSRGLRNPSIAWLTVDPANPNHVLAGGTEGINEIHFAPDADQDGVPDADEAVFGSTAGDANNDGTQDASQAYVASTGLPAGTLAPARAAAATSVGDYVVVDIDQLAPHTGTCARVSDLAVIPTDQIPLSGRMVQSAPTIRFILPDCQSATVNVRYSAVTDYPIGVFGSFSPTTPGDASTQAWGTLPPSSVSVDNSNGLWSLKLDHNGYGNVYAPGIGAILFQGAPGNDSVFSNGFDSP